MESSNEKKKLLIVCRQQFGYLTDIYKWCEYLSSHFDVTVLSFDSGMEKFQIPAVKIKYVPYWGPRLLRGIRYIFRAILCSKYFEGKVLVSYFPGCKYLKMFNRGKRMILDIRTLDVSPDAFIRRRNDADIQKCADIYDFVTVISDGIRKKIGIPEEKSSVLPLGAEPATVVAKDYSALRLIYVGTLTNRHIERTVKGLAIALRNGYVDKSVRYEIVGDGVNDELKMLKKIVRESGLEDNVVLHGYVNHDELSSYFERCNVGISFVPMTDYFDLQPPTKTFEYILAGLYTIATATSANREIINEKNGVVIHDDEISFAEALRQFSLRRQMQTPEDIRATLLQFTWESIVKNNLLPLINEKV